MNSGIYIYTFTSGAQYIGQAIDIKDRWQQHIKKMQSGKHTKLVQAEYNKCGLPDFEVLLPCHPHYLDAMEALYINSQRPALNTVIPKMYDYTLTEHIIEGHVLEMSAYDLLPQYGALELETAVKGHEIDMLNARIIKIAKEKLPQESKEILKEAERALERAKNDKTMLANRISEYNSAGWWHRLWNTV